MFLVVFSKIYKTNRNNINRPLLHLIVHLFTNSNTKNEISVNEKIKY